MPVKKGLNKEKAAGGEEPADGNEERASAHNAEFSFRLFSAKRFDNFF
jgi:hypothetical protein